MATEVFCKVGGGEEAVPKKKETLKNTNVVDKLLKPCPNPKFTNWSMATKGLPLSTRRNLVNYLEEDTSNVM